ncbi:hypothetical protein Bca52824_029166 [Brassica carinata]|uniref:NYN domain-containing protein n=1 Tax=Brassica carinata TaxID=52824 RepID=A0A8X7VDU2_BRACI|nr:hypothetical protein Bca52824_029166 [Brassica carinata]
MVQLLELSFRLGRNQQIQRGYNLVRARSFGGTLSRLYHTADWRWKTLLASVSQTLRTQQQVIACKFTGLSVASFTNHLSTEEHKKTKKGNFSVPDFSPFLTGKMNDQAAPEYVNSKTAVWWDMDTCPVPDGYDARRVRPSIEGALKDLGYCGPITITAMGNLENAHPHVLQGLSSTGILVQHTNALGYGTIANRIWMINLIQD